MAEFWDEWRGSLDGRPTMLIKRLLRAFGWRLDLHKFVSADDAGCFHTHPAYAWRVVLWGGYEEQIEVGSPIPFYRIWGPLNFGIVRPDYCHRVSRLLNGFASYSLWLRAPAKYDVHLRGDGWSKQTRTEAGNADPYNGPCEHGYPRPEYCDRCIEKLCATIDRNGDKNG